MNSELVRLAFSNYYRKEYFTLEEAIEFLWDKNLIDVGEMAEQALVRTSKNLKQNSRGKKGSDFNDLTEHKYSTVRYESANCGRAQINGIKNKVGDIRIMVYEPIKNKNWYFRIPNSAYKKVDSLKVYFNLDGSPRNPIRIDSKINLWEYKCTQKEWSN
jgi:hypothetical protein